MFFVSGERVERGDINLIWFWLCLCVISMFWVVGWITLLREQNIRRYLRAVRKNFMIIFDIVFLVFLFPVFTGWLEITFRVDVWVDDFFL